MIRAFLENIDADSNRCFDRAVNLGRERGV
jgi:hypothetical protein